MIVLKTLSFNSTGIFLSHITPDTYFHFIHPILILLLKSACEPPWLMNSDPMYLKNVTVGSPASAVIHVGALAVQSKPHVRDTGIVLDDTMTMAKHVSHTCRTAYYHLHNIASIRRSLTTSACKIIVHSLVISRLDFGNATLLQMPYSTDCRSCRTLLHGW